MFTPDADRGTTGRPVIATLDEQGFYRLEGGPETPLVPGWYRVAISDSPEMRSPTPSLSVFPEALKRPDLSGLERRLVGGEINQFDFQIQLTD